MSPASDPLGRYAAPASARPANPQQDPLRPVWRPIKEVHVFFVLKVEIVRCVVQSLPRHTVKIMLKTDARFGTCPK